MVIVYTASSGSGEDGDPWDVHGLFSTKELAEAYCNRPDKPKWEHAYVQEWAVEGPMLTAEEREAVATAARIAGAVGESDIKATLKALLERLGGGR